MGIPIDHVLATQELALISRKLLTISGSDHRAVVAEIAFKE
jgi:endonuclease/exonuclease/phosphatase (EEP) superfamily protein YafD